MKKLILASGSPRRKELLEKAGYEFEIVKSDVEENINVSDGELLVRELAMLKSCDVARKVKKDALVIGADTIVCIDGNVLGKPKDKADAKKMLLMLSAREHQVYTGICVTDCQSGKSVCRSERSDVVFRELAEDEIDNYIATGEPMDKAGSYAIQGGAEKFVCSINGSMDNIIGLPVDVLKDIIETEF